MNAGTQLLCNAVRRACGRHDIEIGVSGSERRAGLC
jgi:hypothetical protein